MTILNEIKGKSGTYKFFFWGSAVSYSLLIIVLGLYYLTTPAAERGNEAGLALIPLIIPALLLLPVNLILIPIFLIKRRLSKNTTDTKVQMLAFILWVGLILWVVLGALNHQ